MSSSCRERRQWQVHSRVSWQGHKENIFNLCCAEFDLCLPPPVTCYLSTLGLDLPVFQCGVSALGLPGKLPGTAIPLWQAKIPQSATRW